MYIYINTNGYTPHTQPYNNYTSKTIPANLKLLKVWKIQYNAGVRPTVDDDFVYKLKWLKMSNISAH